MDILNALVAFPNFVFDPRPGLWQPAGAGGAGGDAGLWRPAVFQLCPWRHHGLWHRVRDPVHLVVPVDGHQLWPAAHRASGPALRHCGDGGDAVWPPTGWSIAFTASKRPQPIILVIVSAGVMFVMNGLVRMIIGRRRAELCRWRADAAEPAGFQGMDRAGRASGDQDHGGRVLVVALIWWALLFWFLQKTRTGKSMRAFSDNEDLALLSGINPDRVVAVTWIIAAALATIAGTLYGLDKSLQALRLFPAAAADLCRRHRRRPWQPLGRDCWAASSSPFPK